MEYESVTFMFQVPPERFSEFAERTHFGRKAREWIADGLPATRLRTGQMR